MGSQIYFISWVVYFLAISKYPTNNIITYFSEYQKAALRNDIRQKEADLQELRYGDAMRGAVSIYIIYRIYKNVFIFMKLEFY